MHPLGMRLMQISFKRLPEEHAANMIRAGDLFLHARSRRRALPYLVGAVIFGITCGVGLEAYRQYVLAPWFGIESLPTLPVIALEMLPIAVAIGIGLIAQSFIVRRGRRKTLIAALRKEIMIDIDIYEDGMEVAEEHVATTYYWTAFERVETYKGAVVFYRDDSLFFIPARAFKDNSAYLTQGHEIVTLWKEARLARAESAGATSRPLDLGGEKMHSAPHSMKATGSNPETPRTRKN